ncbi:MAG: PIG-L family deacetylase [Steroidobacteraceae bacterium]|jgi:LmbE family N-acetylglucosaminyl deacetylase
MQSALPSRDSEAALRPAMAEVSHRAAMLARCPDWSPDEGALLVIAPHPNDEILGAGGLIRTWAAGGREVSVLSVSDGEAADPGCEGLANLRREEMKEALRKLCPTHVSVTRLGLPDGRITEHLNRLRNAMLSFCRDRLTLIAPYEHDGHPDHRAVGALCMDFGRSQNIPIARYAIRPRLDPETPSKERWVKFPLSNETRRAKARAIRCFRSGIEPGAGDSTGSAPVGGQVERAYEAFVL